jgi:hypothetical protein
MESNLITVSRMRAFNSCRRLHHYKYELGYRSAKVAPTLAFGTLIHAGLEAWWKATENRLSAALAAMESKAAKGEEVDQVIMAKATVLMCGYDSRWLAEMDDLEVLGVESEFRAPLRNPTTGYPCRDLEVAGKLDVIVKRRSAGKVWFVEHKTSSEDLTVGSQYWQRLRMDPQVSVYYDGAKAIGHDVEGCIYDVVSKFRERPKMATPVEKRKYTKAGTLYAGQRENDETMEEFRARLVESISGTPEAFFARSEVIRTKDELNESQKDTHVTALMIRECERLGRSPRNPDACFLYHRICDFHPVCSGCGSLDDDTAFQRLVNVHPELGNDNE